MWRFPVTNDEEFFIHIAYAFTFSVARFRLPTMSAAPGYRRQRASDRRA